MFNLTRQPKEKDHTWKSCACLVPVSWNNALWLQKLLRNKRGFWSSARLHLKECRSLGSLGHPEQQEVSKWLRTVRPTVSHYLNELLIQKCKFGRQFSRHWPQIGLPHLALWHHVGVTIGITLDKNGSLYDPSGTESCNMQIRLVSYLDKDEKTIYIYRTTVATSCDL